MRIAIVGTRNPKFDYNEWKERFGTEILSFSPSVIVSGGAKGIDSYAHQFAAEHQFDLKEYLPDYQKYGRPATMIRNTQIIQDSDVVFAFPSPESKGTLDSIRKAKKYNKHLIVHEL